jgi:hypothetical protein
MAPANSFNNVDDAREFATILTVGAYSKMQRVVSGLGVLVYIDHYVNQNIALRAAEGRVNPRNFFNLDIRASSTKLNFVFYAWVPSLVIYMCTFITQ